MMTINWTIFVTIIKLIFSAIFGIWEYCHKIKVYDVASVALLTAAALTSPDREFIHNQPNEQDRMQMDFVHTNIIDTLQNHLLKVSTNPGVSFAKGSYTSLSIVNYSIQAA